MDGQGYLANLKKQSHLSVLEIYNGGKTEKYWYGAISAILKFEKNTETNHLMRGNTAFLCAGGDLNAEWLTKLYLLWPWITLFTLKGNYQQVSI